MLQNERLNRLIVPKTASIREAMAAIDRGEYEIALVADDSKRLLGVFTDGDLRRALLAGRTLDDPAMPHATTDPFTVGPDANRVDVLDLMRARGVSQVPVLDDEGRLLGIHKIRELIGAEERTNWALIMAGGRGQRLGRITEEVPKPMVPVAGRPILERIVLHLVGYGITRIAISLNYLPDVIEGHFGDGRDFGCRIEYLHEEEPLGTAGSIALLAEKVEGIDAPVIVMNGDVVTGFSVADLLEHHASSGAIATIATHEHLYQVPFGVLELDGLDTVADLVEKPMASWMVNGGIYVLEPAFVRRVPRTRVDMPHLLTEALNRGEHLSAWPIDGDWIDVGHPSQLRLARGER